MLWASIDVDLIDDPTFLELCQEDGSNFTRFLRLVQVAKRAQTDGQIVLTDGRPATAKAIALIHREPADVWERFFALCVSLELIEWNDKQGCWEIIDWRRWHRSPSDFKESVKVRVDRYRQRKQGSNGSLQHCNGTVTTGNDPETPCNTCNDKTVTVTVTATERSSSSGGGLEEEADDGSASPGGASAYAAPQTTGADSGGAPPEPPPTAAPAFSTWWIARFCELRPTLRTLDHREKRPIAQKLAEAAHAGAPEPVLRWAIDATISQVAHQMREDAVGNPIRYADSLLAQHLENAMTQHRLNQARAETSPAWPAVEYTWSPDDS